MNVHDAKLAARDWIEANRGGWPGLIAAHLVGGALALAFGIGGRDRAVRRVNVIEVPDILPWVKPDELLLTTGFPLRNAETGATPAPEELVGFVEELAARGVSALAVKAGRYLDELPPPAHPPVRAALLDAVRGSGDAGGGAGDEFLPTSRSSCP